jgi:hypothetical protein
VLDDGEAGGGDAGVWPNAGTAKQSAMITSTNNFCAGFFTRRLSPFPKRVFQVSPVDHAKNSEEAYGNSEKHKRQPAAGGMQSQTEEANCKAENCYEKSDENHFL